MAAIAAQHENLSLLDTARLFALANASLHDGLQTSFTSKFVYGLWRPVTAIRRTRSRIRGGIHYQFDSDASQAACVKVAEFIEAHHMRRR